MNITILKVYIPLFLSMGLFINANDKKESIFYNKTILFANVRQAYDANFLIYKAYDTVVIEKGEIYPKIISQHKWRDTNLLVFSINMNSKNEIEWKNYIKRDNDYYDDGVLRPSKIEVDKHPIFKAFIKNNEFFYVNVLDSSIITKTGSLTKKDTTCSETGLKYSYKTHFASCLKMNWYQKDTIIYLLNKKIDCYKFLGYDQSHHNTMITDKVTIYYEKASLLPIITIFESYHGTYTTLPNGKIKVINKLVEKTWAYPWKIE